jgi:RNA polymerase subunit RPABC4/transcription elongation factor Spt4
MLISKKKIMFFIVLSTSLSTLLGINIISAALQIGPIIPIEPINPGIIFPTYTYIVNGTIKTETSTPLSGASVKVSYKIGTITYSPTVTSDPTGKFTKTITSATLPVSGGWTVEISKTGYSIKSQTSSYKTGSGGLSITTVNAVLSSITYTISSSVNGGQCTITPTTPYTVNYGQSVTFTITPTSGYKMKSVSVDGTPVTLSGNSLQLTSITNDHSISVLLEAETNWLLYGGIAAVVIIAAILLFLKTRKPAPPKPTGLRLTSDKPDLPADGRSNSILTIELLDKDGKLMKAVEDTIVIIATSSGSIRAAEVVTAKKEEVGVEKVKNMLKSEELPTGTQVMIKKEQALAKATLTSTKEIGPVKVEASARGLTSATLAINFTEKKRFCMHCGTSMKIDDTVCPKCGKAPPSDVDVKECMNCKTVIPNIAKFCSECGASQPK